MPRRTGLPARSTLAPSLIEAARDALEAALADGALALMIVYENASGQCSAKFVPNLECVRRGLIDWAAE